MPARGRKQGDRIRVRLTSAGRGSPAVSPAMPHPPGTPHVLLPLALPWPSPSGCQQWQGRRRAHKGGLHLDQTPMNRCQETPGLSFHQGSPGQSTTSPATGRKQEDLSGRVANSNWLGTEIKTSKAPQPNSSVGHLYTQAEHFTIPRSRHPIHPFHRYLASTALGQAWF